jgi:HD-like signal output (HDOD) protein
MDALARQRKAIRDLILKQIESDTELPVLGASMSKLNGLLRDPDVELGRVAKLIEMDPSLASRCLRLANSVAFGGKNITNLQLALARVGIKELRRFIALKGVLDTFTGFKVNVDWSAYISHCLLSARITERLASAYMSHVEAEGREYMLGLLHDVGKLFLEHHMKREFEQVVIRTSERKESMYDAEEALLGITHAEIGSIMAHKWQLDPELAAAIRHHHAPGASRGSAGSIGGSPAILAICVALANRLANVYGCQFIGSSWVSFETLEDLPEWRLLQDYPIVREVEFDVSKDILYVRDAVATLLDEKRTAA